MTITSALGFLHNPWPSNLLEILSNICIYVIFQYGPVFTVFVMGTRMTFVTEEEGINVFLKSKEVNFELAVQNPVYRTGKEYVQIVCLRYGIGVQQ